MDGADPKVERAGRDLAEVIGAIDDRALIPDSYWSTFLDDVVPLRGFATQDVVGGGTAG